MSISGLPRSHSRIKNFASCHVAVLNGDRQSAPVHGSHNHSEYLIGPIARGIRTEGPPEREFAKNIYMKSIM